MQKYQFWPHFFIIIFAEQVYKTAQGMKNNDVNLAKIGQLQIGCSIDGG